MWRGIKACQKKKKRLLYKSYYVISIGSRWGELCSFSLQNFKRLCKLGKHPLPFSQGQLDPGSPEQAYLTVTDEAVCPGGWGGHGGGGAGGSPTNVWLPPPPPTRRNWLIGLGWLPVSAWPPRAQGQPLWVHTFTPGQIAGQARKSTHPSLPPASLSLPTFYSPAVQELFLGQPSTVLWDQVLLSLKLLTHLSHPGCVRMFFFCLGLISWNIIR